MNMMCILIFYTHGQHIIRIVGCFVSIKSSTNNIHMEYGVSVELFKFDKMNNCEMDL
jgi:hypothetical protein